MKAWEFASWSRLVARSPFELSAAYTGTDFTPLRVAESLNGERLCWQQLGKIV